MENSTKEIVISIESDSLSFTIEGNDMDELICDLDSKNINHSVMVKSLSVDIQAKCRAYSGNISINGRINLEEELDANEALNCIFEYIRLE